MNVQKELHDLSLTIGPSGWAVGALGVALALAYLALQYAWTA